jgi:hypothetical protein
MHPILFGIQGKILLYFKYSFNLTGVQGGKLMNRKYKELGLTTILFVTLSAWRVLLECEAVICLSIAGGRLRWGHQAGGGLYTTALDAGEGQTYVQTIHMQLNIAFPLMIVFMVD